MNLVTEGCYVRRAKVAPEARGEMESEREEATGSTSRDIRVEGPIKSYSGFEYQWQEVRAMHLLSCCEVSMSAEVGWRPGYAT